MADEIKVEDTFVCLIFLQVEPNKEKYVFKLLKKLISETPVIDLDKSNVYYIYGKFDLLIVLYSTEIVRALSCFYHMLKLTDGITDFTKIDSFLWQSIDSKKFQYNKKIPIGLTLIKLNSTDLKNPVLKEWKVINKIKLVSKKSEYKKHNLAIEILGTYGWNEIILIVYGDSYKSVTTFIKDIRLEMAKEIWETATIPFSCNKLGKHGSHFTTLISVVPGKEVKVETWLKKHGFKIANKYGSYDYEIDIAKSIKNTEYDRLVRNIRWNCPGIKTTTTKISQIDKVNGKNVKIYSKKPFNKPTKNIIEKYKSLLLEDGPGDHITNLRLSSLESTIDMINRAPLMKDLLPDNLVEMIRWIRDEETSKDNKKWFLTYIHYMLQQRLSGIDIGGLLGTNNGFLENLGGFQRLILAAESLLQMACLDYYHKKNNIFLLFEYHPEFSVRKKLSENAPKIICVPMIKYSPYHWGIELHELGHLINMEKSYKDEISNFLETTKKGIEIIKKTKLFLTNNDIPFKQEFMSMVAEIESKYPQDLKNKESISFYYNLGDESCADEFAGFYLDKTIYANILSKYSSLRISKQFTGRMQSDYWDTLCDTLELIITKESMPKKKVVLSDRVKFQKSLLEGRVELNLSNPEKFFAYYEAFCTLNQKQRRSPRCMTSLVLSLYNQTIKLKRE